VLPEPVVPPLVPVPPVLVDPELVPTPEPLELPRPWVPPVEELAATALTPPPEMDVPPETTTLRQPEKSGTLSKARAALLGVAKRRA
jgi:hypothetical protein